MHEIMALVLYYNIVDGALLEKIIQTFNELTMKNTNKKHTYTLFMLWGFLKRKCIKLSSNNITIINNNTNKLCKEVEEVDFKQFGDYEQEKYCYEYVNGFGFSQLKIWLTSSIIPLSIYALCCMRFILDDTNHFYSIYSIMYIFMTPQELYHDTFIDLFIISIECASTKQHLDSLISIFQLCKREYVQDYFTIKQQRIISELHVLCKNNIPTTLIPSENPIISYFQIDECLRHAEQQERDYLNSPNLTKYDVHKYSDESTHYRKHHTHKEPRKYNSYDDYSYEKDRRHRSRSRHRRNSSRKHRRSKHHHHSHYERSISRRRLPPKIEIFENKIDDQPNVFDDKLPKDDVDNESPKSLQYLDLTNTTIEADHNNDSSETVIEGDPTKLKNYSQHLYIQIENVVGNMFDVIEIAQKYGVVKEFTFQPMNKILLIEFDRHSSLQHFLTCDIIKTLQYNTFNPILESKSWI
ncbi:Uncharacterized protein QTN25_005293 [Entamoeba marina]